MTKDLNVFFKYLEKENIAIDVEEFYFQYKSHPDYPSLLSVSDTFSFFGVNNIVAKVKKSNIDDLGENFIAVLVDDVLKRPKLNFIQKKTDVYILNDGKNQSKIDLTRLEEKWDNIVFKINENSDLESSYSSSKFLILPSLILITLPIFLFYFKTNFFTNILIVLFFLGFLFSLLTLKDLFGNKVEIINKFCNITKSSNCETILNSKKNKIFEILNLSDLSIVFFFYQIVFLTISIISNDVLPFFGLQKILVFSSIPLLLFSIYYQKFVENRWCPLCLSITLVILLEMIVLLKFSIDFINIKAILLSVMILSISFSSWKLLKGFLINQKELKDFQIKANRFIRNYTLFKNTILKNKNFQLPETPLILGNNNSKLVISIITNPFCGFCKKTHELVDKLISLFPEDIKIEILIKVDIEAEDNFNKNFYHNFMNNFFVKDQSTFLNSINYWYSNKNINSWLEKFESKDIDVKKFESIYNLFNNWCIENDINYTPAIFINGFEYPDLFDRENLMYYINELIEDPDFN